MTTRETPPDAGSRSVLTVEPVQLDGRCRVRCRGEIDISTADRLEEVLRQLSSTSPSDVAIELTEVTFIDSTGVNAIIAAHRALDRRGRTLRVLGASGAARRLFEITGVDRIVELD
jgi:anti-anti-sigma factor